MLRNLCAAASEYANGVKYSIYTCTYYEYERNSIPFDFAVARIFKTILYLFFVSFHFDHLIPRFGYKYIRWFGSASKPDREKKETKCNERQNTIVNQ